VLFLIAVVVQRRKARAIREKLQEEENERQLRVLLSRVSVPGTPAEGAGPDEPEPIAGPPQ